MSTDAAFQGAIAQRLYGPVEPSEMEYVYNASELNWRTRIMKESILRAAPSNGDDPHIDLSELDRAVEEAAHETAASAIETVNKSSRDAAAVNEVDRAREDLKRRIRAAHQAAQRDHAYAVDEIARIDKVMAMYQSNRMALQAIREEAEDRIVKAKFAMARFV